MNEQILPKGLFINGLPTKTVGRLQEIISSQKVERFLLSLLVLSELFKNGIHFAAYGTSLALFSCLMLALYLNAFAALVCDMRH